MLKNVRKLRTSSGKSVVDSSVAHQLCTLVETPTKLAVSLLTISQNYSNSKQKRCNGVLGGSVFRHLTITELVSFFMINTGA